MWDRRSGESAVHAFDHRACGRQTTPGRREAGISGEMSNRLLDLGRRQSIGEADPHVMLKFVVLARRDERADRDKTQVSSWKRSIGPHRPERKIDGQFVETRAETRSSVALHPSL
jgi:hypothetical protein